MDEGVKKNEFGLLEVFHCGEIIARVNNEAEAWHIYNEAYAKTQGTIHEHREAMRLARES